MKWIVVGRVKLPSFEIALPDLSEWSKARVNIDYHVAFEDNYYRVPTT